MKRKIIIQGLLIKLAVLCISIILSCQNQKAGQPIHCGSYKRIVSLAPSITEILYELGLGDNLVGNTKFCIFPEDAKNKPKMGGYEDPSYEAIIRAKPDLVIHLKEDMKILDFLNKNGIASLGIKNDNLSIIMQSIAIIGKTCDKENEASIVINRIISEMDTSAKICNLDKPRVLLSVGRVGIGAGNITKVWIAGVRTYYHELINYAGGVNVISDSSTAYFTSSSEGVIRFAPDIIIDVVSNMSHLKLDNLKNDWQKLEMVPAVKNGHIYHLSNDYVTIPGPRLVLLLKDIKAVIRDYYKKGE